MNVKLDFFSEEFGIKFIGLPSFAFFIVSIALVPTFPNVSVALFFIGVGHVLTMAGFILIMVSQYHAR